MLLTDTFDEDIIYKRINDNLTEVKTFYKDGSLYEHYFLDNDGNYYKYKMYDSGKILIDDEDELINKLYNN